MNKKQIYKILIVFLLVMITTNLSFAQKKNYQMQKNVPFFVETHIFPADSLYICNLSYKIPYNNLLFVKKNSHYFSGYSVTFEIYEDTKFVRRIIANGEVSTKTYANTFNENLYHEELISFDIRKGGFLIKPSIILNNTSIEASIKPIKLKVDSSQTDKPIFVSNNKPVCDSAKYQLMNFQNSLPFSVNKIDMLIPIYQKFNNPINLQILQKDKVIINREVSEYELIDPRITKCKEQIVLSNNLNLPVFKFYKVNFINQKLREGEFEIKLIIGSDSINYTCPVVWYNKPKSLMNIEKAIGYLRIIGLKHSADSLLDLSEGEQYQALFNFWEKFEDDGTTAFNTILNEFYTRIDYVKKHFNSIGEHNGEDTDRGRIYIIYGKPDNIERTFNELYDVIEIWEYKSISKKMYFSDKTGTGKFERIK